jgi:hypothetical protein
MKTLTNRIKFTAASFRQMWWEGTAEATIKMQDVVERALSTPRRRKFAAVALIGGTALRGQTANAAGPAPAPGANPGGASTPAANCGTGATGSIVKLFQNIGMLLYVVGGIFALVCFAGAALMFMASGNNSGRADKAMKWGRNVVIGLTFLAGGYVFRNIVVDFVGNSGAAVDPTSGAVGGQGTVPNVNGSLVACKVG